MACMVSANTLKAKPFTLKIQPNYTRSIMLIGKTVGERVSNISFERAGLIDKFTVNDGDLVKADAVMGTLDTQRLAQRRKELEADLKRLQVELVLAKKNSQRQSSLLKRKHTAQQAYDETITREKTLEANISRTQISIELIDVELKKSVLHAPYDARVIERFVHLGVYVQAGQNVMKLQQARIDEVHMGIPEEMISEFPIGKCVELLNADEKIKGCVEKIIPVLSRQTQTVRMIFSVKEDAKLFSGELIRLKWQRTIKDPGAWIPAGALVQGMRNSWLIYALNKTKTDLWKVTPLAVQVLFTDGKQAFITGDFKNNEKIVGYGVQKFVPNQKVMLQLDK